MRRSSLFATALSAAIALSIASPSRAATHARKRKKHPRHSVSLEKTVEMLELRIKKLEEVNDKLEHERLQPLDQRVRVLDRRFEVQQEEAQEKAKIAPTI